MNDLKILEQTKELQNEIKSLNHQLSLIENKVNNIKIDESNYKTDYYDECFKEKEESLKTATEKLVKKEKSAFSKYKIIPILGLAIGIGVAIYFKNPGYGAIPALLGFIIRAIIVSPIKKKFRAAADKELSEINNMYEAKLDQAYEMELAERERYDNDLAQAQDNEKAKYSAEIAELQEKLDSANKTLKEINILSDSDLNKLDDIIDLIKSHRADSLKEALHVIDEKQRREEEEKRRQEEMLRAELAAEAARKATMPGKVYVRIGCSYKGGSLTNIKNNIYIDGASYGSGIAFGTPIQLNPGPHTIYAEMLDAGYYFKSPSLSFVLEGSGEKYVKIVLSNGVPMIRECSTYDALMQG